MKLIAFGVAICAGMIRSPSFVDEDEHPPVARFVDDLLDRDQRRRVVVGEQEPLELAERVGGGVPGVLGQVAQGVGMEPRGAGQARTGHAAIGDEATDAIDEESGHECSLSHHNVISKHKESH
jgi:hypothetical protein